VEGETLRGGKPVTKEFCVRHNVRTGLREAGGSKGCWRGSGVAGVKKKGEENGVTGIAAD